MTNETPEAWATRIREEALEVARAKVRELASSFLLVQTEPLSYRLGEEVDFGSEIFDLVDLLMDPEGLGNEDGQGGREAIGDFLNLRFCVPIISSTRHVPLAPRHARVAYVAVVHVEGSPPKVKGAMLLDHFHASLAGECVEVGAHGRVRLSRERLPKAGS